ncbi:MAG: ATP-binding protein [Clostridia bacterium]|nr:ATP-binding protein [Clostridia bacterium]
MKLKWKIFLVSLLFIMAAVAVTFVTILNVTLERSVGADRESAASYHGYFASSVSGRILYKQVSEGVSVLGSTEINAAIREIALDFSSFGDAEAVLLVDERGKSVGNGGRTELVDTTIMPKRTELTDVDCSTVIYGAEDSSYLVAASAFFIHGQKIAMYSVHDVTDTYRSFEEMSRFGIAVSLLSAFTVSVVLLAITAALLRPINTLNRSLGQIACGNYASRAPMTGGTEFREIAGNVNIMAEAVENNVHRLENIAESRKQFTDSFAHEMKTPLTSILCYGDLLRIKREVSEAERLEYSGVIVEEAKRLKALSAKLLELATTESASLELERISLSELFSEIESAVRPILSGRSIILTVTGEGGSIMGDKDLIRSLIYNLIDNAQKASSEGGEIILSEKSLGDKTVITVSDRGIGMTDEVLKRVCEPFFMADKSRSRKAGGAGLGLSLCAEIVRRHGGEISIDSVHGKGTQVSVSFPREITAEEDRENEK